MELEELESVEKLDELMEKIEESQELSKKRQEEIEKLREQMRQETRPAMVDEIEYRIAELQLEKIEFDEMTINALAQAKERIPAVRTASEQKFNEALMANTRARENATKRSEDFILDEEKVREEIQATSDKFKARVKDKALAQAKQIAAEKAKQAETDGKPLTYDEISQIELSELERILNEEYAKIDAVANRNLEKLQKRTATTEKQADYQTLIDNQTALRDRLSGYEDLIRAEEDIIRIEAELTDHPEKAAKIKEELKRAEETKKAIVDKLGGFKGKESGQKPTLLEQYEAMERASQKIQEKLNLRKSKLAKVSEELAKDPDNEKLKKQKENLEKEIDRLEKGDKKCKEELEKYKKLLEEEQKGKGKGDDDDTGHGGPGGGDDDDHGGPGKDDGSGAPKPVPLNGALYYKSLGFLDKYRMKAQAYEWRNGEAPKGLFGRLAVLVRPLYKNLAIDNLSNGQLQPLYEGEEIPPMEEPPAQEPPKTKPEQKKEFGALTDEEKAAVEAGTDKVVKDAQLAKEIENLMSGLSAEQREAVLKSMGMIVESEERTSDDEPTK